MPRLLAASPRRAIAVAVACVAAGMAGAGVYATTLTVTANQDFGATTDLSACQGSSISIQSDGPVYDEVGDVWAVPGFSVNGISARCAGTLYVSAVSTGGQQIEEFTTSLDGSRTTVHFRFASPQSVTSLGSYAIAIHG